MKTRWMLFSVAVLFSSPVLFSQPAGSDVLEEKMVIRTGMDYLEGSLEGDASRVENAVHMEVHKTTPVILPNGRGALNHSGYSRIVEPVRANLLSLPAEERNIQIRVLTIKEGLAHVLASSSRSYDYLQMAKIDGQWKIINILGKPNTDKEPETDKNDEADIREAALDYLEGYYSGDSQRMASGVHPELHKMTPVILPQTGKTLLNPLGSGLLIEATAIGSGLLDAEKRNIQLNILDIHQDIAMVETISAMFYDYLQLAKINGKWQIVNVLWVMNPRTSAPNQR